MPQSKVTVHHLHVLLVFLAFAAGILAVKAQEVPDTMFFCVMSYNVENLFDCKHDSLKDDYEFLPDAVRRWNYGKYKKKLDNIARVITAVGGWSPPALVALCEIENDKVLDDLTRHSPLRENDYRYISVQSQDERGIDVALLYRRGMFKPIFHQSLHVKKPRKDSRPTRDILHVSGLLPNKDTLDVLVAHFPSRSGGARLSAPYRMSAAKRIKETTDSLFDVRSHAQIIVMGDFNDYPQSKSVREVLQATYPPSSPDERCLYHLLAKQAALQSGTGSYKYHGMWQWLDHIIVSGGLLNSGAPLHTSEARAGVFAPEFLLADDKKYGGKQPFRTYYGMKYQGGYSDHLPVYAVFTLIY